MEQTSDNYCTQFNHMLQCINVTDLSKFCDTISGVDLGEFWVCLAVFSQNCALEKQPLHKIIFLKNNPFIKLHFLQTAPSQNYILKKRQFSKLYFEKMAPLQNPIV